MLPDEFPVVGPHVDAHRAIHRLLNSSSYAAPGISTPDLQARLSAASGLFLFRPGDYTLTQPLDIPADVEIASIGRNAAKLIAGADLPYMVKMAGWRSSISGLHFEGGNRAQNAIVVAGSYFRIIDCQFRHFGPDSRVITNGDNVMFGYIAGNIFPADCKGMGMVFLKTNGSAYYGLNVGTIERNYVYCRKTHAWVEGIVTIRENDFECTTFNGENAIIQIGGTVQSTGRILNNYFELGAGDVSVIGILGAGSSRMTINGNTMYGQQVAGNVAVRLARPSLADVQGNEFNRWDIGVQAEIVGAGVGSALANYYANCNQGQVGI